MDKIYKDMMDNKIFSNKRIRMYDDLIESLDTIHFLVAENLIDSDYNDFINTYKFMFNILTELIEMECE